MSIDKAHVVQNQNLVYGVLGVNPFAEKELLNQLIRSSTEVLTGYSILQFIKENRPYYLESIK